MYCREGREEAAIWDPKSVLWAMRKTVEYLGGKLAVCHKRYGLRAIEQDIRLEPFRKKWKGHHIFANLDEIINRFHAGKALSCFCRSNEPNKVHVAFRHKETDQEKIRYTSFSYNPSSLPTCDTGVHFCKFEWDENQEQIEEEEVKDSLGALMLGNTPGAHHVFQAQFTLMYEDWEVLLCYDHCDKKGFALPDRSLFSSLLVLLSNS
jgi:hypothetical protein